VSRLAGALRAPIKALGIARSPRAVRALRETGLYVPLVLLYDGFPARERRRWAELRAFKRTYAPLLQEISADGAGGRRVLFPYMSTPGLYRLRIDGMLAKALQTRGCRPIFVVDRYDIWHEEYLRSFGFRDFVYFDDYLPDRDALRQTAVALAAACASLEDVLKLTFEGFEIGRHAASRVLNRLRKGFLDLSDQEVRDELHLALTNSMTTAVAARAILTRVGPDMLVTSVQNYTPWAEFYEEALHKGVDVIYWSHSHLEGSLLFRRFSYDDRHEHYFTISEETWEELKRMPWTEADGQAFVESMRQSYLQGTWFERKKTLRGKRLKNADEIRADLGLDPSKKTAFVFSHVLYDATFWYGDNLFADYGAWLLETVEAALENPAVNWVIKLHPENVMRWEEATGHYTLEDLEEYRLLRERFGELPSHIRLMVPENDTNTVSLFEFADYALTVRGTVGLEFPCFGVPTLTAGTGGYSGRGFTIDSKTPAEYLQRIARIQEIPRLSEEEVALARRFSYGVFHLKPVPIETFTWHLLPDEQWDHGLNAHDFDLRPRTAEELRSAPDLQAIAVWMLDSNRRELVGRPVGQMLAQDVESSMEDLFELEAGFDSPPAQR
jgi:hypothetical protein